VARTKRLRSSRRKIFPMKKNKIRVLQTRTDNCVYYSVDDLFNKLKEIEGSLLAQELEESRWKLYKTLYRRYYRQYTKDSVTSFDVPNFIQFGITSVYLPRFTRVFLTSILPSLEKANDFVDKFFLYIEDLTSYNDEFIKNTEFVNKNLDFLLINYKPFQ